MSLIALWRSIGGQVQPSSALGQLLLKLAQAISGGGVAFASLQATVIANQANVAAGTDLIFNQLVHSGGIAYDPATGVATLEAGKTYRLTAHLVFQTYAGGTAEADVQWVNADTNVPLVPGAAALTVPVSDGTNVAPSPTTEALVRP